MNTIPFNRPTRTAGIAVALCAAGALTLSACGGTALAANSQAGRGPGNNAQFGRGVGSQAGRNSMTTAAPVAPNTLSTADVAGLLFMREEEKLARDVYTALYAKWQLPIFSSIARSEQTHINAVAQLIARYGLSDPAATNAAGVFQNSDLQTLYDTLVAQGMKSQIDALNVGATIEDLDLTDLAKRASAQTDIQGVYAILAKGSRNHLRAFTSQLEASGVTYVPQYLSRADYDAIVTGAQERGPAR